MTEASELAAALRSIPERVRDRVEGVDHLALRARPGPHEWSAIEVVGHLVDKLDVWRTRAERVLVEGDPALDPYDQDARVRDAAYQNASLDVLLGRLTERANSFARLVTELSEDALERPCRHGEYGAIRLRDCVTLPLASIDEHLAQIAAAVS